MTEESRQRLFVGIEVGQAVKDSLHEARALLESRGLICRWVPANNIHLTLRFLGDCAVETVESVKSALSHAAASVEPFAVFTSDFGAFPNARRARVLWLGLSEPPELHALFAAVDRELEHVGFAPEDRPFHPHITFGRIKRPSSIDLGSVDGVETGDRIMVEKITLFQSRLSSAGATHEVLARLALAENNA